MGSEAINLNEIPESGLGSLVKNKLAGPPLSSSPTLGNYAANAPGVGISICIALAAMQAWINAVNNGLLPAIAIELALASQLAANASTVLNEKLEADNQSIIDAGSDSNAISVAQSQFNTDQAVYGVPVTNYQGVVQSLSQAMQTQTSNENMIISMSNAILQSFVLVA